MELTSASPEVTQALGQRLGRVVLAGDLLLINGPLGAGKTCFVRGLVAGAGGDSGRVRSPTFVLHQVHQGSRLTVHHLDLYRLGPGASLDDLDLEWALETGAAVVEWGEYAALGRLSPATLRMETLDDGSRSLTLDEASPRHLVDAWQAARPRR